MCEKLAGAELHGVRQGVYRIVYEIHDSLDAQPARPLIALARAA